MTTLPFARKDLLAENQKFPDRGCSLAPRCLKCPLKRCRYDKAPVLFSSRAERWAFIWDLHKKGMPRYEIRRQLKVSEQTVYRAIRASGFMADRKENGDLLFDKPGKPVSELRSFIHARKRPWPVIPGNRRRDE